MAGDVIVKNGTLIDGTGRPGYRSDVSVRDGKIVDNRSARPFSPVVDAEGQIVAPGFVDIHTHYDAQVLWDSLCTCSPWHGVTTVVMGNCGFTLAPCRPRDREFTMEMFGRVEGMNVSALRKGLDWSWESFPEYVRRVEAARLGINVGIVVGHSAVRRFVLGEASNERAATADELAHMKAIVREGIAAGAFGFSSSLSPTHMDGAGRPVPSRGASHDEVIELGATLKEFGVGSVGIIPRTVVGGSDFSKEDEELLIALSLGSGRPVNWNSLSQRWERPGGHHAQMAFMERAARRGAQVYAICRCQRSDLTFNLTVKSYFEDLPSWAGVLSKSREQAVRLLRDAATRATMKAEMHARDKGRPVWSKLANAVLMRSASGKYAELQGVSLEEIGRRAGKDYVDAVLDISADEDLRAEFANLGIVNGDHTEVAKIINSPYALAGISDAGAHMDTVSGVNFTTHLLSHWARDEKAMPVEEAVRRMTSMPAALYGITDRGVIAEGKVGDLVIFDLEKLKWLPTERLNDLPGGESRVGNRAEGYEHVIVAGDIVFAGGNDTGARPGKLLKSYDYSNARAGTAAGA